LEIRKDVTHAAKATPLTGFSRKPLDYSEIKPGVGGEWKARMRLPFVNRYGSPSYSNDPIAYVRAIPGTR
jgi:hypothetical protein